MATSRSKGLRFVLHKHAASTLHYDLRLELDGVMKSWALPKGPSRDPSDKRLAVQVGDHPVSYNTFEGTIREGEYGAGEVIVWDRGTYAPLADGVPALRDAFRKGRVSFALNGKRLHGAWTLLRMHGRERQWLLVKQRDEYARAGDDLAQVEHRSIVSKRTLDVAADGVAPRRPAPAPAVRGNGARRNATRPPPTGTRTAGKRAIKPARARPPQRVTPTMISNVVKQLTTIRHEGGDGTVTSGRGAVLDVSSLDKVYFPNAGITKGALMEYYVRVAPALLPLIANRPFILKRFPDGVSGPSFFQHDAPENAPPAVRVELAPAEQGQQPRLIGGDLATLLYQVQLGAIEVNPWLARAGAFAYPDYTVLDLDPGAGATFARVVQIARHLREVLDELGLQAALKTSGKRGLHVYVPVPPRTTFADAQRAGKSIAARVALAHPKEATIERSMKKRPKGSVYVDYVQNDTGKSVAAPFSVRAKDGAPVSTPLAWDELVDGLDPASFNTRRVLDELTERGKLWNDALRAKNTIDVLLDERPAKRKR